MSGDVNPFHILQNSRRRLLIKVLDEMGGEGCLREVVRRLAKREHVSGATRNLVKSIHVSMLQTHIPKMENAGLIKYDRVTDTVHLLELPAEFRYHLEVVEKHDVPWSVYYLTLSLLGVALSLVLGNFLAVVLSLCFLAAALVHAYQTRGLLGMVNESLTRVKHTLTKSLNPTNKHVKKEEE